jgi:polygalacturonase
MVDMFSSVMDATAHGIIGDNSTNNTEAIKAAVAALEEKGGGTLYFPPGKYVTGTVQLKSNITLYLEGGATIYGSTDRADYMPMADFIPKYGGHGGGLTGLIFASKAKNIAVTGRGTIDGSGQHFWAEARAESKKEKEYQNHQPRPRAIQFVQCENILISGVTVTNSAMWTIHPLCSTNIVVDGITIKNPADSPNTDGINPESCSNVRISNCHVDVGDDCVTIKAGTENDDFQRHYPCENITVTNCTMINGHGGVVIGSEMSGGVRNVTISNCVFNGTDRGIRIKSRRKRGGIVEDIRVNNVIMVNVMCPLTMNGYYQCGAREDDMSLFSLDKLPASADTPVFRNIYISNVTSRNTYASAGYLLGIPEMPIENVTFDNIVVEMKESSGKLRDNISDEKPVMAYHIRPTRGEGFFVSNCKDIRFSNVWVKTVTGPDITVEHSENVTFNGEKYS